MAPDRAKASSLILANIFFVDMFCSLRKLAVKYQNLNLSLVEFIVIGKFINRYMSCIVVDFYWFFRS